MLKGDDIKRFVKNAENWQVEFKLAKGGVPDTFWESYSAFANTDGGDLRSLINVGERSGMGLSDLFARWQEAGYAQPTITETYDPDQVTVTVQVELARGKSAVKPAVRPKSAVKDAVKPSGKSEFAPKSAPKIAVKDAVKIAVKRTSPKARPQVIDKCADLYQWLKEDPQRTVQQAVSTLGYSERSVFNYLETLKDASALEHHGPANGGDWVFMI